MNFATQPLQVETDHAAQEFEQRFGSLPEWVATAPGRVNLIGEHTDYNLLPVLPMSIDRKIRIYCQRRPDLLVRIANVDPEFPPAEIDLREDIKPIPGHWTNYVRAALRAVIAQMTKDQTGKPVGMDMLVDSDLPPASGLSSSSALVIASCLAALHASGVSWSSREVAERMTLAEKFVGTAGGGMDQTVISMAESGSALLVEFAPLRPQSVTVPEDISIYIINSGQKAEKTGTARFSYNRRSLECCLAVGMLACKASNEMDTSSWTSLRDIYDACRTTRISWSDLLLRHLPLDPPDVHALGELLGADHLLEACLSRQLDRAQISQWLPNGRFQLFARASHVLAEADRVYAFRDALNDNDITALGHLAIESHASCRDLYHISTPKLEEVAAMGLRCGASGMRITGAGFGGCLVGFVPTEIAGQFESKMLQSGLPAEHLIKANPGDRASISRI